MSNAYIPACIAQQTACRRQTASYGEPPVTPQSSHGGSHPNQWAIMGHGARSSRSSVIGQRLPASPSSLSISQHSTASRHCCSLSKGIHVAISIKAERVRPRCLSCGEGYYSVRRRQAPRSRLGHRVPTSATSQFHQRVFRLRPYRRLLSSHQGVHLDCALYS